MTTNMHRLEAKLCSKATAKPEVILFHRVFAMSAGNRCMKSAQDESICQLYMGWVRKYVVCDFRTFIKDFSNMKFNDGYSMSGFDQLSEGATNQKKMAAAR